MTPERYITWIEQYVASKPSRFVRGLCREAAEEMVSVFPELRLVAGFVHCDWGVDQHWWCVTPDGVVVDPTQEQFRFVYEYEELDLNDPKTKDRIPSGRCLNCGEAVYSHSYAKEFCTQICERSFISDLNTVTYDA